MRLFLTAFISGISTLTFGQIAFAADMPTKAAPAPVVAPAPSWTGFYIGGDVGGAWTNGVDNSFSDPGNAAFASCRFCILPYQNETLSGGHDRSVIGGLYLGYNWQFSPHAVIGVEGDFSWTDLHKSAVGPLVSDANGAGTDLVPVPGSSLSFDTRVNWMATIRGRLGWTFDPAWLIYATGGVAWANVDESANASCLPPQTAGGCVFTSGTTAPFSGSKTRTGGVVGAGLEWQPWAHWRTRLEYLYYFFNDTDNVSGLFTAVPDGGPLPCRIPTIGSACSAQYGFGNLNISTIRVGLSYAF
jgi:outer membrane immunogenic protein